MSDVLTHHNEHSDWGMTACTDRVHAIILAGSHAWQQGSLQSMRPNALLPVVNYPLIDHTLGWLRDAGVVEVSICTNRDGHRYQHHLGSGEAFGLSLFYYEDRVPRGPAGAARDAAIVTEGENFIVIDGSVLPAFDLPSLIEAHQDTDADITEAAVINPGRDERNRAFGAPVGVRMISRAAIESVPPTGFQDLKEMLVPALQKAGKAAGVFSVDTINPRVHNVPSYFAAQRWGLQRVLSGSLVLREYEIQGQTAIHTSAQVDPTLRTVGPVVIGANARIGQDVLIVGPAVVGHDVTIAGGAVLGQSVVWESAFLGEKSVVTQCVVTSGAEVEADQTVYRTICV